MTSKFLHSRTRSPLLAAAIALVACVLPASVPAGAQMRPMAVPAGTPRFAVISKETTVGVGKPLDVSVELQDPQGRKIDAPFTIDIVLTITTLPSLQRAREEASKVKGTLSTSPATLDKRSFLLAAGQHVLRVPAIFPRGQGDLDFKVTSHGAGDLKIYLEAVGARQVQPGSALIIVTEQLRRMRREEAAAIQRIVWSPQQAKGGTRLKFKDSGLDVILDGKDFVRPFSVGLQDENGRWVLPPSRTPLKIQLSVTLGSANFDRPSLTIEPADPISREQTKLRSSVGGTVGMAAQSVDHDIADAHEKFTYELGARATRLAVQPVSTSALANGLDAITLDVSAIFEDGTQPARVMTAAQEGLQDRSVLITFTGGSASQKSKELIILKNATSGTIDVVSSRHSRRLEVHATSINGYQQVIAGMTEVQFDLPWVQLACAIAGGLLVPVIFRASLIRIMLGSVGGALLYILVFFGAVLTGEHSLGKVAVSLTKLPTENIFAAIALGVLGYVLISPALPKPTGPPAEKKPRFRGAERY